MKTSGFSLVELIVVLSILATLLGLTSIRLVNSQQKVSIDSTLQTFISDIKQQQIKAMTGDSEGRVTSDSYGAYVDSADLTHYYLFHGSYVVGDPANFKVDLPGNFQFTSGINIVFGKISGEISAAASVVVKDTTNNNTKTVQINKYGVVTGVN